MGLKQAARGAGRAFGCAVGCMIGIAWDGGCGKEAVAMALAARKGHGTTSSLENTRGSSCGTWRCHWGPDLRDRVRCKRIIARIEGVSKPKAKSGPFGQVASISRSRFGSRRAGRLATSTRRRASRDRGRLRIRSFASSSAWNW